MLHLGLGRRRGLNRRTWRRIPRDRIDLDNGRVRVEATAVPIPGTAPTVTELLELAVLASHVISHVTVGIFVVVYSWVDPINTPCSSAHHVCQQERRFPAVIFL